MISDTAFATRLGSGREFDRIREILGGAREASGVRVGPGDDAAVLSDGTVLTTDMAVEGVHFRLDWLSAEEAGYRAAAGGVSDLAAMGADPIGLLASVAAPGDGDLAPELMRGVRALGESVGAPLLGGDLARSPGPSVLDVVSVGRARTPLLRSAARPGDELWVTGALGGAVAAVRLLLAEGPVPDSIRVRFVAPVPRIAEARWLVDAGVRCGIDLSDGLAGDAAHVAAASGVSVVLEAASVPIDPALNDHAEAILAAAPRAEEGGTPRPSRLPREALLDLALHGGEDYELLVAAPNGMLAGRVQEFEERFGIALTRVGRVGEGSGVALRDATGTDPRPLDRGGYDHFAGPGS